MRVVEVQTGGESAIADGRERERERNKKLKRERERGRGRPPSKRGQMKWKLARREREDRGSVVFELKQEEQWRREVRSERRKERKKKAQLSRTLKESWQIYEHVTLFLSLSFSPTFFVQLIPPVTHSRWSAPFLHFSRPPEVSSTPGSRWSRENGVDRKRNEK